MDTIDMGDGYDEDVDGGSPAEAPAGEDTTGEDTTATTSVSTSVTTSGGDGTGETDTAEDSSGGDGGFGFTSAFASTRSGNGDDGSLRRVEKPALMVEEEDGEPEQPVPGVPQWSTRGQRRTKDRKRKPRGKKNL